MLLYQREMKRNFKSFLIWTLVFVCYNLMIFLIFPTMIEQGESVRQMIKGLPKGFLKALNAEKLDPSNIMSFFSVYSYLYFLLSGGIYAMIQSGGILSREEGEKTVEFLMAKPITRSSIVTSKLLSVFTYMILFCIAYFASAYVMAQTVDNGTFKTSSFLIMALGSILLLITFASIGICLSAVLSKARTVTPTAIGAIMGMFVLGIFSGINEDVSFLKYFSPFQYINSEYIMENEAIETVYLIIMAGLILVSLGLTYFFYNRKDIQA